MSNLDTVKAFVAALTLGLSAQAAADVASENGSQGQHKRAHDFPTRVAEFHQELAQLWHAQPGAERVERICDRVGVLRALARDIETGSTPKLSHGDKAGWEAAIRNMTHRVDELAESCTKGNRAQSEQALVPVHQAFHSVVAYLGHRH